jgi:hypothetical protein
MNFFKNKTVMIVLGVLIALGVLVGGYFFVASRSASEEDSDFIDEQVVESMAPEEIGLTMEAKSDKKAVKFLIAKAEGISSIEYQVTYEADSTAAERSEGGEDRVQRGITGEAQIESGDSSYESEWLDLGSCSKNVCRYDTGVSQVMLTLKIVKDDGKVYQVEQTLEL